MSVAIDVAIGMSFLYLLLALIVSTFQELIASWAGKRATDLYAAIEKMLKAQHTKMLYGHALIKNLRKNPEGNDKRGNPSYIPSKTFALALIDVLQGEKTVSQASGADRILTSATELVDKIQVPALKEALQSFVADARRTADRLDDEGVVLSRAIENWFNDRMARASGWYKRQAQTIALILAVLVVGLTNADTIQVATTLWQDSAIRAAVVERAKGFHETRVAPAPAMVASAAETPPPPPAPGDPLKELKDLEAAQFPLGWSGLPKDLGDFVLKIAGLLLSALAVSLGAGFWFDVLGRVLQVRSTGLRVSSVTGNTSADDK